MEQSSKISHWSWADIQRVYACFGVVLQQYAEIKSRCHIPHQIHISYPDSNNLFIMKFNRDVSRINDQLSVLDQEIARRNNLIGVMG